MHMKMLLCFQSCVRFESCAKHHQCHTLFQDLLPWLGLVVLVSAGWQSWIIPRMLTYNPFRVGLGWTSPLILVFRGCYSPFFGGRWDQENSLIWNQLFEVGLMKDFLEWSIPSTRNKLISSRWYFKKYKLMGKPSRWRLHYDQVLVVV